MIRVRGIVANGAPECDTRWMRTFAFLTAAALLVPAPATAQVEPEYVYIADPRVLVGKYHYEEKGFTIDVSLSADGTALYLVGVGSGGIRAEGVWEVHGDKIHIHNRPGPVRLDPAGTPTRDPSVALRVAATLPDGSPAEGLGVTWPGAAGLFYMTDGQHETRKEEGPVAGEVTIVRASDGKTLASFSKTAGGPNSHRFTYHPSDVEPFEYKAAALDLRADVLEVEVGSASAKLRRVR